MEVLPRPAGTSMNRAPMRCSRSSVKTAGRARQRASRVATSSPHRRGLPAWEPPRQRPVQGIAHNAPTRAHGPTGSVTSSRVGSRPRYSWQAPPRPSVRGRSARSRGLRRRHRVACRQVRIPTADEPRLHGHAVTRSRRDDGDRPSAAAGAESQDLPGVGRGCDDDQPASHLVGRGHPPARPALHRPRGGASVRVGRGGCGRALVRVRRASP